MRGAVCPIPLGSYRYRKRCKTGASLMVDVDVYLLAVSHELDDRKEADQRTRAWFNLQNAADMVEEEDLADLIRSFNETHARSIVAGSDTLGRLFRDGGARAEHIREINEREHDADYVIRATLHTVRRTFLRLFDRGAITSLIGAMDDAIDEMQSAANAVDLYDFTDFVPEMVDMVGIVIDWRGSASSALALPGWRLWCVGALRRTCSPPG